MVLDEILDRIAGSYTGRIKDRIAENDLHYNEERDILDYELNRDSETLSQMKKLDGYKMTVADLSIIEQGIGRSIEKHCPSSVKVLTDLGWEKKIPMEGDPLEKVETKEGKRRLRCMPEEKRDSTLVSLEVIRYVEELDNGEFGEDVRIDL